MGEVIPFRRPESNRRPAAERLPQLLAQAALLATKYEAAAKHLAGALDSVEQAMTHLDTAFEDTQRAVSFCRRCHEAFELDNLTAMIEQRDRLANEFAEMKRDRLMAGSEKGQC